MMIDESWDMCSYHCLPHKYISPLLIDPLTVWWMSSYKSSTWLGIWGTELDLQWWNVAEKHSTNTQNTQVCSVGNQTYKCIVHCSIIIDCWYIHWSVHLLIQQVNTPVDISNWDKSTWYCNTLKFPVNVFFTIIYLSQAATF